MSRQVEADIRRAVTKAVGRIGQVIVELPDEVRDEAVVLIIRDLMFRSELDEWEPYWVARFATVQDDYQASRTRNVRGSQYLHPERWMVCADGELIRQTAAAPQDDGR